MSFNFFDFPLLFQLKNKISFCSFPVCFQLQKYDFILSIFLRVFNYKDHENLFSQANFNIYLHSSLFPIFQNLQTHSMSTNFNPIVLIIIAGKMILIFLVLTFSAVFPYTKFLTSRFLFILSSSLPSPKLSIIMILPMEILFSQAKFNICLPSDLSPIFQNLQTHSMSTNFHQIVLITRDGKFLLFLLF